MTLSFESTVIVWHGPAPYLFAPMPSKESETIKRSSSELSYGWGCIPVEAKLGRTTWKTSLMPKDGRYLVPLKMMVQAVEHVEEGKTIFLTITFEV